MKSSTHYTVNGNVIKSVSLRIAQHLLSLPLGSWPETTSATVQLSDSLPPSVSVDAMLIFAARHTDSVHRSRMPWLRQLGRAYCAADEAKVYPALAA